MKSQHKPKVKRLKSSTPRPPGTPQQCSASVTLIPVDSTTPSLPKPATTRTLSHKTFVHTVGTPAGAGQVQGMQTARPSPSHHTFMACNRSSCPARHLHSPLLQAATTTRHDRQPHCLRKMDGSTNPCASEDSTPPALPSCGTKTTPRHPLLCTRTNTQTQR